MTGPSATSPSAPRSSRPAYRPAPSSTARYSYQTASTGMTSPTSSGTSFWGGGRAAGAGAEAGPAQGGSGWKRYAAGNGGASGDEESTIGTELTVPSDSPGKEDGLLERDDKASAVERGGRPPSTHVNLPSTRQASAHPRQLSLVREETGAESALPSRHASAVRRGTRRAQEQSRLGIGAEFDAYLDTATAPASPLKHSRSRKRSYQLSKKIAASALGPSADGRTPSPTRGADVVTLSTAAARATFDSPAADGTTNSLARGAPSPSLTALAGSRIVMSRINRLQAGGAEDESPGPAKSSGSDASGLSSRRRSYGKAHRVLSPSSTSHTCKQASPQSTKPPSASRIRAPAFPVDSPSAPRPASPTLDRAGSARRMIDVFESLPHTPTGYTINSDGSPTPARAGATGSGSAARTALQAISARKYHVANAPLPRGASASPAYSSSYLRKKALPPDPPRTPASSARNTSLYPPPASESNAPTLLSAYSPHGKLPIRDDFPLASSMAIPASPRGKHLASPSSGKSAHSRSPLSKSPLKEIISAFSSMGKKVAGRRRRGMSMGQDDADNSSIDWYAGRSPAKGLKADSARSRSLPRDKMGDKEMSEAYSDIISPVELGEISKQGQLMYLQPAPCASFTEWGEWTRLHATLHPSTLRLAAHDAISQPVLIDMRTCTDLRTLRSGEIHSRGIPNPGSDLAFESTNVQVIEFVFQDNSRQYIGVEGISERLAWTTSLWDVLVGGGTHSDERQDKIPSTPEVPYAQPPYSPPKMTSPVVASTMPVSIKDRMAIFERVPMDYAEELPKVQPTAPLHIRNRVSMMSLQGAQPDQQPMGDAPHFTALSSFGQADKAEHGVQDETLASVRDLASADSVPAERQLSVFSTDDQPTQEDFDNIAPRSSEMPTDDIAGENDDFELSFDDSDLNPSRSASQRAPRRRDTVQSKATTITPQAMQAALAQHVRPGQILAFPEAVPTPEPGLASLDPSAPEDAAANGRRVLPATPALAPGAAPYLTSNDLSVLLSKFDRLPEAVCGHLKKDLEAIAPAVLALQHDQQPEAETVDLIAAKSEDMPAGALISREAISDLNTKLDLVLAAVASFKLGSTDHVAVPVADQAIPVTSPVIGAKPLAAEEIAAAKEISDIMVGTAGQNDSPGQPADAESEAAPGLNATQQKLEDELAALNAMQTGHDQRDQKTADMARYMAELNDWLEKFVTNGTTEIQSMSGQVSRLVEQLVPPPIDGPEAVAEPQKSLPAMINDMQAMLFAMQAKQAEDTMAGARLDGLVASLGQDRQRQEASHAAVENVMTALDRQRGEHETLLRALATDLTSEIRGERLRFVEAMKEATNINVHMHVEEFKKSLSQEIAQHSQELAAMREQKRSLEAVISDLLSIKAKYAAEPSAMTAAHSAARSPAPKAPAPAQPGRSHTPRPLPIPH